MAKNIYNNETFLRGRVGKNVYKVVRGKQVVSPFAVPRNPNTVKQIAVRLKMSLLGAIAGYLLPILKYSLHASAQSRRTTPFGRFVHLNYANVTGVAPDYQIDWDELQISEGNVRNISLDSDHIDQTSVPGTVSVAVQERGIEFDNSNEDDLCYLALVCPELKSVALGEPRVRKTVTELECTPPTWWSGHKVYLYNFTTNPENTKASESTAVGKIDFIIE